MDSISPEVVVCCIYSDPSFSFAWLLFNLTGFVWFLVNHGLFIFFFASCSTASHIEFLYLLMSFLSSSLLQCIVAISSMTL